MEKYRLANLFKAGFKLTFQSCIVKNTCKISRFSFTQICTMVGPTENVKILLVVCSRLLENAFWNVN